MPPLHASSNEFPNINSKAHFVSKIEGDRGGVVVLVEEPSKSDRSAKVQIPVDFTSYLKVWLMIFTSSVTRLVWVKVPLFQ